MTGAERENNASADHETPSCPQPAQRPHATTAPIVVRTGKQRHTQKGCKPGSLPDILPSLPLHTQPASPSSSPQPQLQQHQHNNKRPPSSRKDEDKEIKRLKALRELLVTERSYVNDLGILLDVYLQSLATVLPSTTVNKGTSSGGSAFSCSTIISAVVTLLGVNRALLSSLETRISPFISDEIIKDRNAILSTSSPAPQCHFSSHPSSPASSASSFSLPSSFYSPASTTDLSVGDIMLKMADFLKVTNLLPSLMIY